MQLKNKQQTVLTTDWHYSHKNMEKLCNRPFGFEALIHQHLVNYVTWLKFAGHDITVINLGDVCWSKQSRDLVKKTNQDLAVDNIILVKGNHDHLTNKQFMELGFTEVVKEKFLMMPAGWEEDYSIHLTHSPMTHETLDKLYSENIHGHLHQNYQEVQHKRQILLSQELMDYHPITLEEVLTIGATPKWVDKGFVSIYT